MKSFSPPENSMEARDILIVRLSSMGDIIHTLPAFSLLREEAPEARIDWLVDAGFAGLLDEVDHVHEIIPFSPGSAFRTLRLLRRKRYDLVIDFQGLIKSAILARLAVSRNHVGFSALFAREGAAAALYSTRVSPGHYGHVIMKNIRLLESMQVRMGPIRFPWAGTRGSDRNLPTQPYAVLIPGASWSHKCWPAESFGQLAAELYRDFGLRSVLTCGSAEERLRAVRAAELSHGAAAVSDTPSFRSLRVLLEGASVIVGADTGPLHFGWALNRPGIGIFGPTRPSRNGPWSEAGTAVSRHEECRCHYRRRCSLRNSCVTTIPVEEVREAVEARLNRQEGEIR